MSVEIRDERILVKDDEIYIDSTFEIKLEAQDSLLIKYDYYGSDLTSTNINKRELASLIVALQTMHDKMVDV